MILTLKISQRILEEYFDRTSDLISESLNLSEDIVNKSINNVVQKNGIILDTSKGLDVIVLADLIFANRWLVDTADHDNLSKKERRELKVFIFAIANSSIGEYYAKEHKLFL